MVRGILIAWNAVFGALNVALAFNGSPLAPASGIIGGTCIMAVLLLIVMRD
jgi:hypothetical protein